MDEKNGINKVLYKKYSGKKSLPEEKKMRTEISDTINDILRDEAPIHEEDLKLRLEETYSQESIDQAIVNEIIGSLCHGPSISGYQDIIWNLAKYGNYQQVRSRNGKNRDISIEHMSREEMINALKYCYDEGKDDEGTIDEAFNLLGLNQCPAEYLDTINDMLNEIKPPIDYDITHSVRFFNKKASVHDYAPYFTPSEFHEGHKHLTVDFFLDDDELVSEVVKALKEERSVKFCPALSFHDHKVYCNIDTVYGYISFKTTKGNPIELFKKVLDKVNKVHNTSIEFANWKPWHERQPSINPESISWGVAKKEAVEK